MLFFPAFLHSLDNLHFKKAFQVQPEYVKEHILMSFLWRQTNQSVYLTYKQYLTSPPLFCTSAIFSFSFVHKILWLNSNMFCLIRIKQDGVLKLFFIQNKFLIDF